MYIDPTGHIVTNWDKEHLSKKEQDLVKKYTDKWNRYNKKVNDSGLTDKERLRALKERDKQHEYSERIRDKYRNKNEAGRGDGHTVNKNTNEIVGKEKEKKDKEDKKGKSTNDVAGKGKIKPSTQGTIGLGSTPKGTGNGQFVTLYDPNKLQNNINVLSEEAKNSNIVGKAWAFIKALGYIVADKYKYGEAIYVKTMYESEAQIAPEVAKAGYAALVGEATSAVISSGVKSVEVVKKVVNDSDEILELVTNNRGSARLGSASEFPSGAASGKDVVKFLKKEGFEVVSQNGSHVKLKGPGGEITVVPVHGNKSLGRGLLEAIKKQAGF